MPPKKTEAAREKWNPSVQSLKKEFGAGLTCKDQIEMKWNWKDSKLGSLESLKEKEISKGRQWKKTKTNWVC